VPLNRWPHRTASALPLALLLALAGCSTDNVFAPQKFFPGSDRHSFSDCGKFGPSGSEPQVCAGFYTAPGKTEATYFISFFIPAPERVRIAVYDQNAKLVKTLLDSDEPANLPGFYRQPPVEWDFTNHEGARVPPGDYRIYLSAGDYLNSSDVEAP
jgi:hypothetical protein